MARYVLHATHPEGPTADELELIGNQATILDKSRRALLVDVEESAAAQLAEKLPGWSVQPENRVPIPDTKRRIK
ncbi:hypothetical protein [Fibrella arboris]|uniref:hypothetical protein n=1 Tax=Fibrella arboris TaxID=3242486 RepID=UPI003520D91F